MSAPHSTTPRTRGEWWKIFDRLDVLAALEAATATALDPNDPLPDSLIASAQALGLLPHELRMFIYDEPKREDWSHDALARFARQNHMGTPPAEGERA